MDVCMAWFSLCVDLKLTCFCERNDCVGTGPGEPVSTVACNGSTAALRSTVFINDVAIEVGLGPFNVREAFGDNIVLIHSSGQPVFTNEWGVTLQSLQHGASYYLVPLAMAQPVSPFRPLKICFIILVGV